MEQGSVITFTEATWEVLCGLMGMGAEAFVRCPGVAFRAPGFSRLLSRQ